VDVGCKVIRGSNVKNTLSLQVLSGGALDPYGEYLRELIAACNELIFWPKAAFLTGLTKQLSQ